MIVAAIGVYRTGTAWPDRLSAAATPAFARTGARSLTSRTRRGVAAHAGPEGVVTKRLLLILFVVLMPFQMAWAGAAAYCQHETEPAKAKHFGHHEHRHTASSDKPAGKVAVDLDCSVCHAAGASIVSLATCEAAVKRRSPHPLPLAGPPLASASAPALDRPNWLRLA